ncbi:MULTISPECIES: hypothetical protein [unclassified Streptomyces]|uniref:hypothetical protein n=1 Tax=unclassified Streptomyces TaxID=2593676 RepID=UPI000AF39DD5|nr:MULTISPECIES: hypothetical protein [unclassified Streptomyces]
MAAESNARTSPSRQRGILLVPDRPVEQGGVVYVCVDDGFPGGFPIGRAIRDDDGTWCAYARFRPGRVFADDRVATGLPDLRAAVRKVLAHARYTDPELSDSPAAVVPRRRPAAGGARGRCAGPPW